MTSSQAASALVAVDRQHQQTFRIGPVQGQLTPSELMGGWVGTPEDRPAADISLLMMAVSLGLAVLLAALSYPWVNLVFPAPPISLTMFGVVISLFIVILFVWIALGHKDWRTRLPQSGGQVTLLLAHRPVTPHTPFLSSHMGIPVAHVSLQGMKRLNLPVGTPPQEVKSLFAQGEWGLVTVTGCSEAQAEALLVGVLDALSSDD